MARAARSLDTLRNQINKKFPLRDKASDGGIGDAAHSARKSDHNPNAQGIFHARDFDHDPDANGLDAARLWRELIVARDPRTKYLIFSGRIWFPSGGSKVYTGPNAHMGHLHISVLTGVGDDPREWNLPMLGLSIVVPIKKINDLNPGLTKEQVEQLQGVLNRWYPRDIRLVVDGDYGPATASAVRFVQAQFKIEVDGIAGPQTLAKLGLNFGRKV